MCWDCFLNFFSYSTYNLGLLMFYCTHVFLKLLLASLDSNWKNYVKLFFSLSFSIANKYIGKLGPSISEGNLSHLIYICHEYQIKQFYIRERLLCARVYFHMPVCRKVGETEITILNLLLIFQPIASQQALYILYCLQICDCLKS